MPKILFISDFNFSGSGYMNISTPICDKLSKLGYDIKAVGLGYDGREHPYSFSLIPCASFGDAYAITENIIVQGKPDFVIVALDIPRLEQFIKLCTSYGVKIISITPLENPPLTMSWANILSRVDKVFFISQLGVDEAVKAGIEAEHLVVGVDAEIWRMRTFDEYRIAREALNISPDTLVVLTVADNQERKNLSKAMEIISKVKENGIKVKYILITRENSNVGWKLRDLAIYYNIPAEVMIFERGMAFKKLFLFYTMADAYLLTSKGEGLCEPVLEAMSVGVPVVATACGSLPELLGTEYEWQRGFLMETAYPIPGDDMIDPWGNETRIFPKVSSGVQALETVYRQFTTSPLVCVTRARNYVETRTWDKPIQQLMDAMEKLK